MKIISRMKALNPVISIALFLAILVGAFMSSPSPVRAADEPQTSGSPAGIAVQLAVNDITNVDELAETFDIDAYLSLQWTDTAAYALLPETNGTFTAGSTDQALAVLEQIGWSYIIMFSNQVGSREQMYATLSITPEGEIAYTEHFQGTFRSKYYLQSYPFDHQVFKLRIESCEYDAEKAVFIPVEDKICYYQAPYMDNTDGDKVLDLEEWNLDDTITSTAGSYTSVLSGRTWSYITIDIGAQRKAGFHIWKIFLPLLLIILVSWSVFWMKEEDVTSRMSVSMIAFLSAVSFGFYISSNLPEISYLTFMDYVITGVYVFMTITVVIILATYLLMKQNREALADRVNNWSRGIIPLSFVLYLFAIVMMLL